jgi:hypothetical protein
MIKIKEYPPVISIMTIIEDRLLGAKSYPTVIKRLKELQVKVFAYGMVRTDEFFNALLPKNELPTVVIGRKAEPFKLPSS